MYRTRTILFLTIIALIPSLIGYGTIISFGKYAQPDLPKSELATLQIDTNDLWPQATGPPVEVEIDLIQVRISGKLAVRKKIEDKENISIDDIYVVNRHP